MMVKAAPRGGLRMQSAHAGACFVEVRFFAKKRSFLNRHDEKKGVTKKVENRKLDFYGAKKD